MIGRFDFPNDRFKNRIKRLVRNIAEQQKNIKLLEACARKLNLEFKSSDSNYNLELYFDIYKNSQNICYVYKGWDDPGFRVGELIELDKSKSDFKERFYDIFRICSERLITISLQNQGKSTLTICLEIGIYKSGFNGKVFKEAIKTLQDALSKIRSLL
jgi:hypothetical protein